VGAAATIAEGVGLAAASIDSGAARGRLDKYIQATTSGA
jgi:anthranilate phosphoribosyltransferase